MITITQTSGFGDNVRSYEVEQGSYQYDGGGPSVFECVGIATVSVLATAIIVMAIFRLVDLLTD